MSRRARKAKKTKETKDAQSTEMNYLDDNMIIMRVVENFRRNERVAGVKE